MYVHIHMVIQLDCWNCLQKLTVCVLWVGGSVGSMLGLFLNCLCKDFWHRSLEIFLNSWVGWGQRPFAFKRCRKLLGTWPENRRKHISCLGAPMLLPLVLKFCVFRLSKAPVPLSSSCHLSVLMLFISVIVIFCPAQCLWVAAVFSPLVSPLFGPEASPWAYSLVQIPLGASLVLVTLSLLWPTVSPWHTVPEACGQPRSRPGPVSAIGPGEVSLRVGNEHVRGGAPHWPQLGSDCRHCIQGWVWPLETQDCKGPSLDSLFPLWSSVGI